MSFNETSILRLRSSVSRTAYLKTELTGSRESVEASEENLGRQLQNLMNVMGHGLRCPIGQARFFRPDFVESPSVK